MKPASFFLAMRPRKSKMPCQWGCTLIHPIPCFVLKFQHTSEPDLVASMGCSARTLPLWRARSRTPKSEMASEVKLSVWRSAAKAVACAPSRGAIRPVVPEEAHHCSNRIELGGSRSSC